MVFKDVTASCNTKIVINGRTGKRDIRQSRSDETICYTDPSQVEVRCGMCGTQANIKVANEREFYDWYRNP
jgi:hypothetical protein